MKKIIAVMFSLAVALTLVSSAWAAGSTTDDSLQGLETIDDTVVTGSDGGDSDNSGNDYGTVTSNGVNLSVGPTSTTVTWETVSGAVSYYVVYALNDQSPYSRTMTETSVSIPVGYENCGYGFSVNVFPMNANHQIVDTVLTASFTRNYDNTSYTDGLTLTEKNSNTTTISWKAASNVNVNFYLVMYARLDGSGTFIQDYTSNSKTSIDIPLGRADSFQVYVYAITTDSFGYKIGEACHVGGDEYPPADSFNDGELVITSAKGGNGTIDVTWSDTTGAVAYQVWIAKEGSNSYSNATSTKTFPNAQVTISGTTANINGIPAGTYKIRIKASMDGVTWYELSDSRCIKSDYATVTVTSSNGDGSYNFDVNGDGEVNSLDSVLLLRHLAGLD